MCTKLNVTYGNFLISDSTCVSLYHFIRGWIFKQICNRVLCVFVAPVVSSLLTARFLTTGGAAVCLTERLPLCSENPAEQIRLYVDLLDGNSWKREVRLFFLHDKLKGSRCRVIFKF